MTKNPKAHWKVLEREAVFVKQVRTLVDIVASAQKVRAENACDPDSNIPDSVCAQEVALWESRLRNTFGLIYLQADCIVDADEWVAFDDLKKRVKKVMPEYVKKLPKIKSPV